MGLRALRELLLLLLLRVVTGPMWVVVAQQPPQAPPPGDSVPCDRWQVFNDHNAVYSRVGAGCNGGATAQPPCRAEGNQGVGKHYFYLGIAESMGDCLELAQVPIPTSAATDGPTVCQTVGYHSADFKGPYSKHCYCGTDSEWIAVQYPQKDIDSASCQSYGTPTAGALFSALLIVGGALYAGGGIAVGQQRGNGRGMKAHPHYSKLAALGGLVADGVALVRGGGTSRRRPYAAERLPSPLLRGEDGGGGTAFKSSKESKGSKASGSKSKGKDKGKVPAKGRSKDSASLDDLTASEGSPKGDRPTASERVLTEQVEQDERLHQSQAKIKVIGLNG